MTSLSLISISLCNFKHHTSLDLDLDFSRDQLIKFSGDSGSGKSSAVAGISYGLFGKVWKSKGLCKYGEKSFSVTLVIGGRGKDILYISLQLSQNFKDKN